MLDYISLLLCCFAYLICKGPKLGVVRADPSYVIAKGGLSGLMYRESSSIDEVDKFRIAEGSVLHDDFVFRIGRILALLNDIEPLESARIAATKAKFEMRLQEISQDKSYDQNRLEQELIYYFEKLDITEEKIRLRKHCDYFITTLDEIESPGKKLGFITQEIGREINTLGSKANDAQIQMIVVQMKDELEKIKEQLANIL